MSWIGRKKIAFIPLQRPNFDAFPVPPDWPNQILRRVLFDPIGGADQSLRTYIHTASSGRADLDAVVKPMQVLNQKDVPPDALDGQLGSQLRDEGFDAAALVMLGLPPTGQGQLGGFWARFDMSEAVGVWAMELMHCLTGFTDLYSFNGNMGAFDEMACSCGTHPSAYTKAAIDWLDQSAIAQHIGRTVEYDLHSVGLIQPPPYGRWAAVRIGSQVPYLMVESRQRVDQFDNNIPSQGVIVYRVQTSDPHGLPQNATAPVELLTTTATGSPRALSVGELFTDTNVSVSVTTSIPGGFTVVVVVTGWSHSDLTQATGAPSAVGDPAGYTWDVDSTQHVVYRGTDGHIYELWFNLDGGWHPAGDLTQATGAPSAVGDPAGYTWDVDSTQHVVYRGTDGHIYELWFNLDGGWHPAGDLTQATGAPRAVGDPAGYTWDVDSTQHVVYRGTDGHIYELWFNLDGGWHPAGDLTQATGAPRAVGDPAGYTWDVDSTQHVVYRGTDGHIYELWFNLDGGWHPAGDLTQATGAPRAVGDPAGYTWDVDSTQHVVYRGTDGHIYELWFNLDGGWHYNDLTQATGAPPAVGDPAGYTWDVDSTQHVVYRGTDGHIYELWFNLDGGWHYNDLTQATGAPSAAGDPAGYTWDVDSTQHVVYRGTDGHIHELWFGLA